MRLTDIAIRGLSVDAGQRDVTDDDIPGLTLRVGKRAKTFMLLVGSGASRKRITLGRYPTLKLAGARSKAKALIGEHQNRKDSPPSLPFTDALELFLKTHCRANKASTAYETERLLRRHFHFEADLSDLNASDVMNVIDALADTPGEANHAFAAIRTFFRWAAARRYCSNPIDGLRPPHRPLSRERVLSDEELVAVLRAASERGTYGKILELLVLTGQRLNQIASLRSEFVNAKQKTIEWPADLMKGNRRHAIPYGDMAAALLSKRTGLLFTTEKGSPFNSWSKSKADFDTVCPLPHWTLHDLRRTFASGWQRLGVRVEVTEAMLAHRSGTTAGIVGVYQRHDYLPECREAVKLWEDHLQSLLRSAP